MKQKLPVSTMFVLQHLYHQAATSMVAFRNMEFVPIQGY